jgi:antitoxin component HigA of HigAB toxin-antitoxin module
MADVTKFFDKAYEQKEFSELADAPIDALAGISKSDADTLKKALNIETIRDLAENKFVLAAQAVMAFSRASKK